MSIRWLKNVIIDNEKTTLEIQLGEHHIGDKCYTRIGNDIENWFVTGSKVREDIISEGLEILKKRLSGKKVTFPDGREYDWN
ncbi:MAG: hypothetical protein GF350_08965 [Chitinivibrionales bacterium]|nr:hypothetical protein [Chitinivibrionales bacterium]